MRFIYLDESGIGDSRHEPHVVVAGIIIEPDKQLKDIEQYLDELSNRYIHPLLQKSVKFHAKELYNGGKNFPREQYSREIRWEMLEKLCSIPKIFNLPVVVGMINRDEYGSAITRKNWGRNDLDSGAQMVSTIVCMVAAEKYLRSKLPNELALLIIENNQNAKKKIQNANRLLKDGDFTKHLDYDFMGKSFHNYFPITKIAESPLFAEKKDSSVLVVADSVAWAINRKLNNGEQCDRFFSPIDQQITIIRPKVFGPIPVS